jgi:hypothetical protein
VTPCRRRDVGAGGQYLVLSRLAEKGIEAYEPLIDDGCDVLIYCCNQYLRCQVKATSGRLRSGLSFDLRRRGSKDRHRAADPTMDIYFLVDVVFGVVYVLPSKALRKRQAKVQVELESRHRENWSAVYRTARSKAAVRSSRTDQRVRNKNRRA